MNPLQGFKQEDFEQSSNPLAGFTQADFSSSFELEDDSDMVRPTQKSLGQRAGEFLEAAKQGTIRGWRGAAGTADLMTTGLALNMAKGLGLGKDVEQRIGEQALQVMEGNELARQNIESQIPKGYEAVAGVSEFFTDPTSVATMVVGGPLTKGAVKKGLQAIKAGTGGTLAKTGNIVTKVAEPAARKVKPLADASLPLAFFGPEMATVAGVLNTPRMGTIAGKNITNVGNFIRGNAPRQLPLQFNRPSTLPTKVGDILSQGTATGLNLGGAQLTINKIVPETGTAAIYEAQRQ